MLGEAYCPQYASVYQYMTSIYHSISRGCPLAASARAGYCPTQLQGLTGPGVNGPRELHHRRLLSR